MRSHIRVFVLIEAVFERFGVNVSIADSNLMRVGVDELAVVKFAALDGGVYEQAIAKNAVPEHDRCNARLGEADPQEFLVLELFRPGKLVRPIQDPLQ